MQSIQAIKSRISSIASTRQITQSMRLVSTAKVQRCRARMVANRPFLEEAIRFAQTAAQSMEGDKHPYLTPRKVKATGVLLITGDRGLCGGYNISAARQAFDVIDHLPGEVRLVTVGSKAIDYCRRKRLPITKSFTGVSETPLFEDAANIADLLLGWYNSGEVDELLMVSTEFVSMLVQNPRVQTLLPLALPEKPVDGLREIVRCEPAGEALLEQAVPFYLSAFVYGALLEASASEQSARITSMDSAVKSSDEMMDSLSLLYNQARQGAITQELIEIVGGAGAVQQEGEG